MVAADSEPAVIAPKKIARGKNGVFITAKLGLAESVASERII
jgi:hypothetical protein